MSTYQITVNGETFVVEIGDVSVSPFTVVVNGEAKSVTAQAAGAAPAAAPAPVVATPAPAPVVAPVAPAPAPAAVPVGSVAGQVVKAPMPGKILSIRVKVGDKVAEGDTVTTLEAMKMEMPISSTASGTVKAVHVDVGQNVAFDDALITLG
jgi:biotin carboxyl carrier protein